MQETPVRSWVRKIPWRRDRLPTPVFLGFPCGSAGKESTCDVGDLGSIPGLGRFPGEGKGYPLQYSGLENSMDCIVHGKLTNLDSIFKSRDITLPTKVRLVKAMVFPVVMYGCESWTIKKAESRRIDAFELWCWRRLFRVPWTARRSNQSILVGSPLGDQSWDFFGRNDAKAETPVLWPPHVKS